MSWTSYIRGFYLQSNVKFMSFSQQCKMLIRSNRCTCKKVQRCIPVVLLIVMLRIYKFRGKFTIFPLRVFGKVCKSTDELTMYISFRTAYRFTGAGDPNLGYSLIKALPCNGNTVCYLLSCHIQLCEFSILTLITAFYKEGECGSLLLLKLPA